MDEPAIDQKYEWLLDLRHVPGAAEVARSAAVPERPATQAGSDGAHREPAQLLQQLPFLKSLHRAQITKILKICTVSTYEPGAQVCGADTGSDEMYILIAGEIAVRSADGIHVTQIQPVTTVGELGFIAGCARPIVLEVTTKSRVLCLRRERFQLLLRAEPDIQLRVHLNVIEILSNKLTKIMELVQGALAGAKEA